MAAYGWGTDHPVEEWLFEEGYRFDFYQAVRLLEMIYPDRTPVGETSDPHGEVVRFRSGIGLSFPGSDISEVTPKQNGEPAGMTVNFLGLAGTFGPLPLPYTEMVLDRSAHSDTAMEEFLNIFNHRLVSLMHRVRKTNRVGLDFRSPDQGQFARYLYSIFGMGTGSLKGRMNVPDRSLLFYSGHLARQPRTMSGLAAILGDYFTAPIEIRQLVGRWLELEEDQLTAIGLGGRNNRLGDGAVVGRRVWDQAGKFEVVVGPIGADRFADFLPHGTAFAALCSLTRFHVGQELEFDIILLLDPNALLASRLGMTGGTFLGWTSWLHGRSGGEGFSLRLQGGVEGEG